MTESGKQDKHIHLYWYDNCNFSNQNYNEHMQFSVTNHSIETPSMESILWYGLRFCPIKWGSNGFSTIVCFAAIAWVSLWWRHQMKTFSALLGICAGNSTVTGEFPTQRPVTRGYDIFFDLRLNKWLSKQSWGRWFETPSHPLWRHCNAIRTGQPLFALVFTTVCLLCF